MLMLVGDQSAEQHIDTLKQLCMGRSNLALPSLRDLS